MYTDNKLKNLYYTWKRKFSTILRHSFSSERTISNLKIDKRLID